MISCIHISKYDSNLDIIQINSDNLHNHNHNHNQYVSDILSFSDTDNISNKIYHNHINNHNNINKKKK